MTPLEESEIRLQKYFKKTCKLTEVYLGFLKPEPDNRLTSLADKLLTGLG